MMTRTRIAVFALAGASAIAALSGAVIIYAGLYDVSATSQHTSGIYYVLEVSMQRSVRTRAADIEVPALEDENRTANGFKLFHSHCLQCHGAPGVAPEPFALGLTPMPASLVAAARQWSAAEAYWIIKYGIKMSGMPAWEYRLSDEQIWDVVGFMKVLPTLSPTDYQQWSDRHQGPAANASVVAAAGSPGDETMLGDVDAGRRAVQQYLCATCHVIPDVVGARHHVGPSLAGIASRRYIAGVLPNSPENMVRWLRNPQEVDPLTAMPNLGVTERDARDIAAFLYTLQKTD